MNYLAHAYQHLDAPYFMAGTALPDWMSVIDRKNRPRRQFAQPVTDHADPLLAAVAQGCVRHHEDDDWFHQSRRFVELSTQFAVELRQRLAPGLGHQAGFTGHIVVELLLDSVLCEKYPRLLDDYYAALNSVNFERIQLAANEICPRPVTHLSHLLPKFIKMRFLADYQDDTSLLMRLNDVMRRVRLPPLPDGVAMWLATIRPQVRQAADELLRKPA